MLKRELAQFLEASGALEGLLQARAWSRTPCLTVLTYHRLHDNPAGQSFDEGVIDATPEQFDQQVATLRRYFSVIGVKELLGFLDGRPLPPNPALITFDDGYRDSHDLALPILQKHGVNAVFFIATSYVSERRVFWWDRISYISKTTTRDRIELTYPIRQLYDLRSNAHRKKLLKFVKSEYALDVERFLVELASAAGVPWDRDLERRYADELVITWDQVRALRRAGMEIHSHTRTHRVLQSLPPAEFAAELAGARKDIEQELGEPVTAVSYPVGRSIASWPEIRAAVKDAGYRLGFSNCSGVSWLWGKFDPFDVRRISVEHGLPLSYFRALLAIPSFAETQRPGRPPQDRRSVQDA